MFTNTDMLNKGELPCFWCNGAPEWNDKKIILRCPACHGTGINNILKHINTIEINSL